MNKGDNDALNEEYYSRFISHKQYEPTYKKSKNIIRIPVKNVIERLQAMKSNEDLPEFDYSKEKDTLYCVEWGIKKGEWITDGVIDRYILELQELLNS